MNEHSNLWVAAVVSYLDTMGLSATSEPLTLRSAYSRKSLKAGSTQHVLSVSHVASEHFTLVQAWWNEDEDTVALHVLYGPQKIRFTEDGQALQGQDWFLPDLPPDIALELTVALAETGASRSHLCN
jgi:hypothetical protein